MKQIKWNINFEDVEIVANDPISLEKVIQVDYITDTSELEAKGYEGGYIFTYEDNSIKQFAYKPYPHNYEPLAEI